MEEVWDWDAVWQEPSDDLWCKPTEVRIEHREWEPTRDDDPGEGDYFLIEYGDLGNPDRQTFPLSFRYPGTSRSSKWSIWKNDMKAAGHPIRRKEDILRYWFHFKMKDLQRGKVTYTNYPEPVAVYDSEEVCLQAMAAAMGGKPTPEATREAPDEWVNHLVGLLVGKTLTEALPSIVQDPVILTDTKRMSKVISGELVTELIALGIIEREGDKFTK